MPVLKQFQGGACEPLAIMADLDLDALFPVDLQEG